MRDTAIEHELTELGLSFGYQAELTPEMFDRAGSAAVQVRLGPLDDELIDKYADVDCSRRPALVCYAQPNGRLVIFDGNHRSNADQRRKRATDAYVVPTGDAADFDRVARALYRYAVAANVRHGKALSSLERWRHAARLVNDHGYSDAEAAKAVGLGVLSIRLALQENVARQAAVRIGVGEVYELVPPSYRPPLGELPNEILKLILEAFHDYGFKGPWVADVAKEVRDVPTGTAKQIISDRRLASKAGRREMRAAGPKASGKGGGRSPLGVVSIALLQLQSVDPAALVRSLSPGSRTALAQQVAAGIRVLDSLDTALVDAGPRR